MDKVESPSKKIEELFDMLNNGSLSRQEYDKLKEEYISGFIQSTKPTNPATANVSKEKSNKGTYILLAVLLVVILGYFLFTRVFIDNRTFSPAVDTDQPKEAPQSKLSAESKTIVGNEKWIGKYEHVQQFTAYITIMDENGELVIYRNFESEPLSKLSIREVTDNGKILIQHEEIKELSLDRDNNLVCVWVRNNLEQTSVYIRLSTQDSNPPLVIDAKGFLIYEDGSTSKFDIVNDKSIALWNTIIGEGSAEQSSNKSRFNFFFAKNSNYNNITILVESSNGVVYKKENLDVTKGDLRWDFEIETGCSPIEIKVIAANKEAFHKSIPFECGE